MLYFYSKQKYIIDYAYLYRMKSDSKIGACNAIRDEKKTGKRNPFVSQIKCTILLWQKENLKK